ncbi:MAG: transporter [Deltaproteobacteria bacterium]|nr:transporter [Deltaproteobacteria bacterium]
MATREKTCRKSVARVALAAAVLLLVAIVPFRAHAQFNYEYFGYFETGKFNNVDQDTYGELIISRIPDYGNAVTYRIVNLDTGEYLRYCTAAGQPVSQFTAAGLTIDGTADPQPSLNAEGNDFNRFYDRIIVGPPWFNGAIWTCPAANTDLNPNRNIQRLHLKVEATAPVKIYIGSDCSEQNFAENNAHTGTGMGRCNFGGTFFYAADEGNGTAMMGTKFTITPPILEAGNDFNGTSGEGELLIFTTQVTTTVNIQRLDNGSAWTWSRVSSGATPYEWMRPTGMNARTVYLITADKPVVVMNNSGNAYESVPSIDAPLRYVGENFLFSTVKWGTALGVYNIFAYTDAVVNVWEVGANGQVYSQGSSGLTTKLLDQRLIPADSFFTHTLYNGVELMRRRLFLEVLADPKTGNKKGKVAVWTGGVERPTQGNPEDIITAMGDDFSVNFGSAGRDFVIHAQDRGAHILAMYDDTDIKIEDIYGPITVSVSGSAAACPYGSQVPGATCLENYARANRAAKAGDFIDLINYTIADMSNGNGVDPVPDTDTYGFLNCCYLNGGDTAVRANNTDYLRKLYRIHATRPIVIVTMGGGDQTLGIANDIGTTFILKFSTDLDLDNIVNADEGLIYDVSGQLDRTKCGVDANPAHLPDTNDVADATDCDSDGDGVPDIDDCDSDNDGIRDIVEKGVTNTFDPPRDSDGDRTPDCLDTDSDGDGISDCVEAQIPGFNCASPGTGAACGSTAVPVDTDGDGIPDYLDLDSDNDGKSDAIEGTGDVDCDGIPNYIDANDNDGPCGDLDGDGIHNGQYIGGICVVAGEACAGSDPNLKDSDGDGIGDQFEVCPGNAGTCQPAARIDTDVDGTPDCLDTDSDGDGILDNTEAFPLGGGSVYAPPDDHDGDGTPNYRDSDSDNDGQTDLAESTAASACCGANPASNCDGDVYPNYLDEDSDGDGMLDFVEAAGDNDADACVNYLDPNDDDGPNGDLDGDTIQNGQFAGVCTVAGEACAGSDPNLKDTDGDGIGDRYEVCPGLSGTCQPVVRIDTDNDGTADCLDTDSDGDGILDSAEAFPLGGGSVNSPPDDHDGDGTPNFRDADSDGDGMTDLVERSTASACCGANPATNCDGDTYQNYLDEDSDGDGTLDSIEGAGDSDGDACPNFLDTDDQSGPLGDSDADGVQNGAFAGVCQTNGEACAGSNPAQKDSDGDGIGDRYEVCPGLAGACQPGVPIDTDTDATPDCLDSDSDGDGIPDSVEGGVSQWSIPPRDSDGDGIPDYRDSDSDNDGIPDAIEGAVDTDGDTVANYLDWDSDGDGKADSIEGTGDADGDGIPNFKDSNDSDGPAADADGDGIPNGARTSATCVGGVLTVVCATPGEACICWCSAPNAAACSNPNNPDTDGDLIGDRFEICPTSGPCDYTTDPNAFRPIHTDVDGIADVADADSDNDGIPDSEESGLVAGQWNFPPRNTDGDGQPDYRDTDSDNDGISDTIEASAAVGQCGGNPVGNCDADPFPNYIDSDSDGDGKPDQMEGTGDTDGDGFPNYLDVNENDGPDGDSDGDGLRNGVEAAIGTDPNDADTDGDGIGDFFEVCKNYTACDPYDVANTDGDGIPDWNDADSDNDQVPDSVEYGRPAPGQAPADTDGDGTPDFRDLDSDNDTISDTVEYVYDPAVCTAGPVTCAPLYPDADGDGIPNFREFDADNDGAPDVFELTTDIDDDGIPNWLDASDNVECVNGDTLQCPGSSVGACRPGQKLCIDNHWSVECFGKIDPQPEICDGVDNDCDGTTDEADAGGLLSIPCGSDVGECRAGVRYCVGGTYAPECTGEIGPAAEICDGLDNDCDGAVDEGCSCINGQVRNCGLDTGECSLGTQTCVDGQWGTCQGAVNPVPEVCDNKDNDCDGLTDEDLTRNCGDDTGTCEFGVETCAAGVWGACTGGIGPGPEICDNLDNDCDGQTDEGLTRTCSSNVGECREGVQTCGSGSWGSCVGGVFPQPEVCDGKDNNCDGTTDEGCACIDGQTRSCGSDVGECVAGTQTCAGGAWGACAGATGPQPEVCDNLDNNCDGLTDENLSRQCGSSGTGACRYGTQACTAGAWGPCQGNIEPVSEVCNNIDDDCDGQIDENITQNCGTDVGECQVGVQTCTDGMWSACVGGVGPRSEICNGLDDDCDGADDEGLSRVCGSDVGECQQGLQTCAGGNWGACVGEVQPSAETCDGKDNNCDGVIDEGCQCQTGATRPCGETLGICEQGVQSCVDGVWGSCNGAVWPETEVCDGLDNDCDGFIDDNLFRPCGSDVGECASGQQQCGAGVWGPCVGEIGPAAETCDGRDNDCDAMIDEAPDGRPLSQECGSDVGECRKGFRVCENGIYQPECSGAVLPVPETCDGKDNNCNGTADEGCACLDGSTRPCGSSDVGACRYGTQTCVDGQWAACAGAIAPQTEICDGIDNDCDGATDDGPGGGQLTIPCGSDVGECRSGLKYCIGGAYGSDCVGEIPPAPEVCDGVDNDCDNAVDEGCSCIDGQTRNCGTDTGECVFGTQTCAGGQWGACEGGIGPIPETCDNKDNDCDGTVDEDLFRQCGDDTGACEFGTQQCSAGAWGACQGEIGPSAEVCDGVDNDCDGTTDEELARTCSNNIGECRQGTQTCVAGSWGSCVGGIMPVPETCDGRDNNCDGTADEGCACVDGTARDCGSDIGECAFGTQTCVSGAWDVCVGSVNPVPENCDNKDNDCDGAVDENLYQQCGSSGTGACRYGTSTCAAGAWGACQGNVEPVQEVCNGVDDDCDGEIDENLQMVCGTDTGECQSGVQTCTGGVWSPCAGSIGPRTEVCDGLDNDCDGSTDENLDRVCGSSIGECRTGAQTCVGGNWGECVGEVKPAAETCDGLDNNCDGSIDEGCQCQTGTSRPCGYSMGICRQGTQSCVDGVWGACNGAVWPETEICDGLDNDCDGFVDEGITRPCGTDTGECLSGTQQCASGSWGECTGSVGPIAETCDGKDNDCDGMIDEAADGRALTLVCGTDVGECTTGLRVCTDGAYGSECTGAVLPTAEICDTRDNDCDGTTDEGCQCTDGDTRQCGSSNVGACRYGTQRCSGGAWAPCVGAVEPQSEICDGVDNDCDGTTDESDQGGALSIPCGSDIGTCRKGVRLCAGGQYSTVCTGEVGPQSEVCDGRDNDCNGATDEGCSCTDGSTRDCGTSNQGICRYGTQTCAGGVWGACAGAVEPQDEICDNLDNDCDGNTDEEQARPCGKDVGACRHGYQYCSAGNWGACQGAVEPETEVCDGIDNDCDGQVDEALARACSKNVGICREGVQVCSAGQWGNCDGGIMPQAEVCDAQDNDCDGTVDEGCDCTPGEVRSCGLSIGTCVPGAQTCTGGAWGTCDGAVGPQPEICDNLDNDCDGQTDEGLTQECGDYALGVCRKGFSTCEGGVWTGCVGKVDPAPELCDGLDNDCDGQNDEDISRECGTETGECKKGTQYCVNGSFTACAGSIGPAAETCDGKDNDCDGMTDEYLNRSCGSDEGECRRGTQSCMSGTWGACDGEMGPAAETCDGLDNDCDAVVDNVDGGCACNVEGETRACGSNQGECTAGTQTCTGGQWGGCAGKTGPAPEMCDGLDNDCDGETDESLQVACGSAVGACRQGISACTAGGWGSCEGMTGPSAETCDGVDNDCDGLVDEEITVVCGSSLGTCRTGLRNCYFGQWGACVGEIAPSPEICDGQDNDCDGEIDEGCSCKDGETQLCGSSTGECVLGIQVCSGGIWGLCMGEIRSVPELCDGKDNDCDGEADENIRVPCGSGVGACRQGFRECANGVYSDCQNEVGPSAEVCDGIDNDCDGIVDEYLVRACGTDEGACVAGSQTCANGVWGECLGEVKPVTEACGDGVDNDCNGQIDEGCSCNDGDTQWCGSDVGECKKGTQTCSGGRWGACTGEVKWDPEKCDGLDNDCDGAVDEELFTLCGTDVGECSGGISACSNGALGPCLGEKKGVPEACDGLDNDCDGQVDEDITVECGSDMGECRKGVATCLGGTMSECLGQVGPIAEICDNLDNDCDGLADNGLDGCATSPDAGVDGGEEAGEDAGTEDTGTTDAETDAGADAGADAGKDAETADDASQDAETDIGTDAGATGDGAPAVDSGRGKAENKIVGEAAGGGCQCSSVSIEAGGDLGFGIWDLGLADDGPSNIENRNPAAGAAGFLLAVLGIAIALRRRGWVLPAIVAGTLLLPSVVSAQKLNANRMIPAADSQGYLAVDSGEISPPGNIGIAFGFQYMSSPLIFVDDSGKKVGDLVDYRVEGGLVMNYSVIRWFEVGGSLPVIFSQDGLAGIYTQGRQVLPQGGIGDLLLIPKFRVLSQREEAMVKRQKFPLALSFMPVLLFPTGDELHLEGAKGNEFSPRVAVSQQLPFNIEWAVNLGYTWRPETKMGNEIRLDDEFLYDIGIGYRLPIRGHQAKVSLEYVAALSAVKPFDDLKTTPMEVIAGGRYHLKDVIGFSANIGAALTPGIGAPQFRVLAGIFYDTERATDAPKFLDASGAGLPGDAKAAAPAVPAKPAGAGPKRVVIAAPTGLKDAEEAELMYDMLCREALKMTSVRAICGADVEATCGAGGCSEAVELGALAAKYKPDGMVRVWMAKSAADIKVTMALAGPDGSGVDSSTSKAFPLTDAAIGPKMGEMLRQILSGIKGR